ncbi:flavodoxin family protein [Thermodesulfobacteriota bacterium]
MKILGISGSPHKGGNTDILLGEALSSANEAGVETELLEIRDRHIKPCDGCLACGKSGRCRIKDDMQHLYRKLLDADGIIFGTPVYFWSMTGMLKVFIDRTIALQFPHRRLANKVGGIIVVASRTGVTSTSSLFYVYFSTNQMFAADYVHGFATAKSGILKDKHAMKSAWELGKQVTSFVKARLKYPAGYAAPIYQVVAEKYGLPISPSEQPVE